MTEAKRILYRGIPVIEGWPEKVAAAQCVLSYTLNERTIPRVRYGDETDDWGADKSPCHDCRAIKGEFHVPSCDVEQCPGCGGQLLSCDCPFDERADNFPRD
jgi:hypothetical protein